MVAPDACQNTVTSRPGATTSGHACAAICGGTAGGGLSADTCRSGASGRRAGASPSAGMPAGGSARTRGGLGGVVARDPVQRPATTGPGWGRAACAHPEHVEVGGPVHDRPASPTLEVPWCRRRPAAAARPGHHRNRHGSHCRDHGAHRRHCARCQDGPRRDPVHQRTTRSAPLPGRGAGARRLPAPSSRASRHSAAPQRLALSSRSRATSATRPAWTCDLVVRRTLALTGAVPSTTRTHSRTVKSLRSGLDRKSVRAGSSSSGACWCSGSGRGAVPLRCCRQLATPSGEQDEHTKSIAEGGRSGLRTPHPAQAASCPGVVVGPVRGRRAGAVLAESGRRARPALRAVVRQRGCEVEAQTPGSPGLRRASPGRTGPWRPTSPPSAGLLGLSPGNLQWAECEPMLQGWEILVVLGRVPR